MADDNKKRSLHIFYAKPSNDNNQTRVWVPTGEHIVHKNDQGGYFTDAYLLKEDIEDSGVQAGHGQGFVSFSIEDGGDDAARTLVNEARQGGLEVVGVYREYKLEQGEGVWENIRVTTVWGYIAAARLQPGASSISLAVHVIKTKVVNDKIGTRQYSLDCITGSSTIKGGTLGAREPHHIAPPGTPEATNWGAPLAD